MNRRDFLGLSSCAAGAALLGCRTKGVAYTVPQGTPLKGALLHLGSNMWGDYGTDPTVDRITNFKPGNYSGYWSSLVAKDECWKETVDYSAAAGLNLVVVDVADAVVYPSHPELAIRGSWSVEKLRAELARMRGLGLEPIPKLNFSAGHHTWLKEYARMLSTRPYYRVVDDLIADTCEIFDNPRFFHIGMDEECALTQRDRALANYRQGDLWWHDLRYIADCCKRRGARPIMFSDKMWWGHDEFLRRMDKDILQSPWYYQEEFDEDHLTWDYKFEKSGAWPHARHGAATMRELFRNGYDILPCCSNCYRPQSVPKFVDFCKRNFVGSPRYLGLYVASWGMSIPGQMWPGGKDKDHFLRGCGTALTKEGIDQLRASL